MEIAVHDAGAVKIMYFEGELDSQSAPVAEVAMTSLVDDGATKVLVNLAQLAYISSAGLRVLLMAAKQLKRNAGEVRICMANPTVMEVFEISGFTSILTILPTEEEALAGF